MDSFPVGVLKSSSVSPEDFIKASEEVAEEQLNSLKALYDLSKSLENADFSSTNFQLLKKKKRRTAISDTEKPLDNLIVHDFDEEQIWEEIQLQNTALYDSLVSSVSKLVAHCNLPRKKKSKKSKTGKKVAFASETELHNESEDEEDEETNQTKNNSSKRYSRSIVDDKFFNLSQMTEFLENVESELERKNNPSQVNVDSDNDSDEDDDSIDLFNYEDTNSSAGSDDEEHRDYFYKEFFDPPMDEEDNAGATNNPDQDNNSENEGEDNEDLSDGNSQEMEEDDPEDEEENEILKTLREQANAQEQPELDVDENKKLSAFEKSKKQIEATIEKIEDEALEEKPWYLQGEVTANKRPENSLLEQDLVYDHLVRHPIEITVETTKRLEDIIRQRVKDKLWDDVERKLKPVEDPFEFKKRVVLDSEKSKMSLSQIYEKEYLDKKKAEDGEDEKEVQPEEHKEIEKQMRTLFAKLDALSNYHFTPIPVSTEVKIVTNLPTIAMEEVAPVSVSDATMLAPQEIDAPEKGELLAKEERTDTDRKRERRKKKKFQKLKRIAQEEKSKLKGLGSRNIKIAENLAKKSKDLMDHSNSRELRSSKAFFSKLQDESKISNPKKSKRPDSTTLSAKRFKL